MLPQEGCDVRDESGMLSANYFCFNSIQKGADSIQENNFVLNALKSL